MGNNGGLYTWSQTAAANATADNTINWQEGQAPSSINDSGRAMMASAAKYRDDVSGMLLTTGTNNAYAISTNQDFDSLADMHQKEIWFTPHVTNIVGSPDVTVTVDAFANIPLRSAPNTPLVSGVLIQGTPYGVIYNNTDGAFYLKGYYGNLGVPLFVGLDYWSTVAPASNFIIPQGQAISRTAFAAAFAVWGTTFGAGDGSTTFNVPDKTGRVSAMMEATATRLTSAFFGGDSTKLGSVGNSSESHALVHGEIPTITATGSGSAAVNSTVSTVLSPSITNWANGSGITLTAFNPGGATAGTLTSTGSASVSTTSNNTGGTSPQHANVQPTIVCNYIIRII